MWCGLASTRNLLDCSTEWSYWEWKVQHSTIYIPRPHPAFVTHWAKTSTSCIFWKSRPEIRTSMCNYVPVEKWELSEKASQRRNATFREMFLHCYVSPYNIVLHKIDTCSCKKGSLKVAKDRKDSGCESRGIHCVYWQKDNRIQTGSWWNHIFGNAYHDVHSNMFPHFADLPVSSNLYRLYSSA